MEHYTENESGNYHELTGHSDSGEIRVSKHDPGHAQETDAVKGRQGAFFRRTIHRQDPQTIDTNGKYEQVFSHDICKISASLYLSDQIKF